MERGGRVLIISYYFAPENTVGALRFTKIAKYMDRDGYETSVLCAPLEGDADPKLQRDIPENMRLYRIMKSDLHNRIFKSLTRRSSGFVSQNSHLRGSSQPSLKRFLYLGARKVYSHLSRMSLNFLVSRATIGYLKRNGDVLEGVDVVISTYGPNCNHTVASWIKRNAECRVAWIADFRDGMDASTKSAPLKALIRRRETTFCNDADAITIVARGCVSERSERMFAKKIHTIPNGFDLEDVDGFFRQREELEDALVITYSGAMYTNNDRDASPLFRILSEFFSDGTCNEHDVVVRYAGRDFNVLKAQASAYGVEGILRDEGLLSRDQSLALQQTSDILLHLTTYDDPRVDVLSGKLFEYMAMDKPIISLVTGSLQGSKVKELITEGNLGICIEAAQPHAEEALRAYLVRVISEKQHGSIRFDKQDEYVNQFDYRNIAHSFEAVIDDVRGTIC